MSQENAEVARQNRDLEVLREVYSHWERGDFTYWEAFADDYVWKAVDAIESGEYTGIAEVSAAWRTWLQAWDGFSVEAEEVVAGSDGRYVVMQLFRGKGKASGLESEERSAAVVTMRDGLIARMEGFWDRDVALQAAGVERPLRPSKPPGLRESSDLDHSPARDTARAMSEEKMIARLRQLYEAVNSGDLDGMMQGFHDDVEYLPFEESETLHGHDAVRRYFEGWLDAWDAFQVEPTEFLVRGDHAVAGEAFKGRGKGSGVEVAMQSWSVSLLRDDQVVRRDEFLDRAEALEAAGLRE